MTTGLLGAAGYSMNQASYDLARLRTNGLITRVPGKNRYRLTGDGLQFRSSTPKSMTGYCGPSSLPTIHPPR